MPAPVHAPIDLDAVRAAVAAVPDPEMAGVGIGDLGLVEDVRTGDAGGSVAVDLVPTFLGCPALEIIRADVETAARAVAGVEQVTVRFVADPAWSTGRISPAGHAALADLGIAVDRLGPRPAPTGTVPVTLGRANKDDLPPCPHCGSGDVRLLSTFGPTSCRSSAWCDHCRSAIEVMRA